MPNQAGKAYGLSVFSPIKDQVIGDKLASSLIRTSLENLGVDEHSPFSKVPNTYLARFYILEDPVFESYPYKLDHLQSRYLVFSSNFYGERDQYLRGMYEGMQEEIKEIWQYCYAFDQVKDADSFVDYIRKCQVPTTFFFDGSNADSLEDQLKSLYLKQEFSKFVFANQDKQPEELLASFKEFESRTKPNVSAFPTWRAGAGSLNNVVINQ